MFVHNHDFNVYQLGSMAGHNVIIASLPYGEYGTASAARVASDMLSSFPNIRMGLLVGIAGGAPSPKNDIRLGDIVVGVPTDGENGVLQYDFGKAVQERKFQVTRMLDPPPMLLRNAASTLRNSHRLNKHRIHDEVDAVLERYPLLKEFQRPPSADRLFKSSIVYDANNRYHESCLVWYGTIASANRLIKDATIRDELTTEKNVLCFEMEAGGVMNHFPCLVVRGICDYSDTHKNDSWQGYVAMVAAVYAKRLLQTIPPHIHDITVRQSPRARSQLQSHR
ncbi:nucleoside phosphorylase domain-containing protein [Aspergillus keveii]|uniref:Nucleoside phosphorylase domain-containing protein n=1 Tax=Aspergillus keveii TaxID=714993 RepID=A0ABR4FJE1_9EURO